MLNLLEITTPLELLNLLHRFVLYVMYCIHHRQLYSIRKYKMCIVLFQSVKVLRVFINNMFIYVCYNCILCFAAARCRI